VINNPLFNRHRPDENDIYVFSGYIKPGNHYVYVFDPMTDRLYKKTEIIVFPRKNEKITHRKLVCEHSLRHDISNSNS